MSKSLPPLDCLAHLTFGLGKLLVQTGEVDGKPSLFLLPSKHIGVPGAYGAPDEPNVQDDPNALRRSVVLTFPNEAQRDAVESALLGRFK